MTFKQLTKFFKKPSISREAFDAYYHRLPTTIQVSWERDGKFIVGEIKADDKSFFMQGTSAQNFIDLVNESIYVVNDIPKEYINAISDVRPGYDPKPKEREALENASIKHSKIIIPYATKTTRERVLAKT